MRGSRRADRRRWILLLAVPVGIYGLWFATIGRTGIGVHRDPFTLESVMLVPGYVLAGIGEAFGALTGVGPALGLIVGIGLGAVAVRRLVRGEGLPARFVGAAAGIVAEYTLIAVTRGAVTEGQVAYTRYTYESAVLGIIAIAALVGLALRRWPAVPGRARALAVAATAVVFGMALLWNGLP